MEAFRRMDAAKGPSLFLIEKWMDADARLTSGFTSRLGGSSSNPWTSLNCGLHVGDADEDVVRNRQLVAEALEWPFEAWTCAEQVHGSHVHKVTIDDRGRGRSSRDTAIADTDALITGEKDVLLASFYADCVPLYYYDPVREVIALAHAGWKGTVLEIARETAGAMQREFGCRAEDIRAAIGPSIGGCCYEVDSVVLERVEPLVRDLADKQSRYGASFESMVAGSGEGKAHINLKEINRQIMIKAGILPINIEMTEWCTGCSTDIFFSHRMEGGATGRMASWIGMRRGEART
ncbi:peptidoglycan editing factor PgeF [Paenibacillus oenotherae]|uniref:Purine nucleoside phosphorylase n=1 Tax=Paenibacillus oenotherae TaxID=1435645 RepID=A0ABS7D1A5_9BACL|nr:peptidoglycan editing factor PgeF [Paenibacillus oenotherae]MBW7473638.1 peptidoglycan editing factor PgeF [Paenibacillus oenotherae]